jgi:GntR family transcriptional regulator
MATTQDPLGGAVINRGSAEPYYRQISDFLRAAVDAGHYTAGTLLPSEKEFCEQFGVSRPVVRQALEDLSRDGYVYRVKGKGTFVAEEKLNSHLIQVVAGPERDTIRFRDRLATSVILREMAPAPVQVSRALDIPVEGRCVHLRRLRLLDDEPLCVIESYLPEQIVPGLLDADLIDRSLYDVIEERNGVAIRDLSRRIEAAKTPVELSDLLAAEKGDPCLIVTSLAAGVNGAKLEWSQAIYRADRISLNVEFPFGEAEAEASR